MIPEVLNSYSLTLDYLRRLIEDVPDESLAEQPVGVVNHPLWTIGHLVYSAQMIGSEIGLSPWLPGDWVHRYGTRSIPVSDRLEYPSKSSLLDEMGDARRRLADRLNSLGSDAMHQLLPDVRYREIFPTLGHAVTHILLAHTAGHVGQVVVWRRLMGFAPLAKEFD